MADPKNSWALVVGIDRYNDGIVPPLDGAAADAVAAVRWLLGLGVPREQILLHTVAQPATALAVAALNLAAAKDTAAFDAIDESLQALSAESGDRLYVFLAGHAVYEPSEGRLFLCQDFANRGALAAKALGIDALVRHLLSYPFAEQFLFMDGCQNFSYSAAVRRKFRSGLDGTLVTPDEANNGLVTVFGASMGELAEERDGRGAFFGTLLPALDPGLLASVPPQQGLGRALTLDFESAESLVDLEQLVGWTRESMQAAGIPQTPNCVKYGKAAAGSMPLLRLPPASLSEVILELSPPGAAAEVSEVTVTCDDLQARRRRPPIGVPGVTFPDQFRVPMGTAATIVCRARPGSKIVPAWERVEANGPQLTVRFSLEPLPAAAPAVPEPARLRVMLRQPDGSPAYEMSGQIYHDLESRLGPNPTDNVRLATHETGPEFVVTGGDESDHRRAVEIAANWSVELGKAFAPRNISVAASGVGDRTTGIRLRLPPGVRPDELAGPGSYFTEVVARALGVAPDGTRPASVAVAAADGRELELPPGPAKVSLSLPWGSWSQVVNVPPSGVVEVELPASIGTPPLRVGLANESRKGKRRILGVGAWPAGAPEGTTADPGGKRRAKLRARVAPAGAAWELSAPGSASVARLDRPTALTFPLFGERNFVVGMRDGLPRVEPLSDIESPEWDLLVGSGQLEALDPEQAARLTDDKWFDDLLGLAGAYAVYAHLPRDPARLGDYLQVVLSNLTNRLGHRSTDHQLLAMWLRASRDGSAPFPELAELARARAMPLFRWGIPVALDLLERQTHLRAGERRWQAQLSSMDETVSPASAWTVLRA